MRGGLDRYPQAEVLHPVVLGLVEGEHGVGRLGAGLRRHVVGEGHLHVLALEPVRDVGLVLEAVHGEVRQLYGDLDLLVRPGPDGVGRAADGEWRKYL